MYKFRIPLWIIGLLLVGLGSCSKEDTSKAPAPSEPNSMDKVDDMVYHYMSKNSVPGATLAVSKNGKLVYTRAYGFADKESGERMKVETRSRISSISKTVTSIAIMKLMEEGKIGLDDKVFGDGSILGNDFGKRRPYRKFVTDLTVKHCLSHHVGGWGNASNDPTMMRNDLNASELVSYIIDNVPLSEPPGTSFAYSNAGFMILGRVIEKVSGKNYEQYVKEEILKPLGITTMEIGGNTLEERKPNEARYDDARAYTRNFSRRDANGGWIATASDIVWLFVHIDGFPSVPDILQSSTLQTMTTPPFDDYKYYALGIYVNGGKWYHGGSFNGSRSQWLRNGAGFVAMIMVNGNATNLGTLLDDIVGSSVDWPDQDLF